MREPRTFAEIALSGQEVFEFTRECPGYTFVGLTTTKGFSLSSLTQKPHTQMEPIYYVAGAQEGTRGELHVREGYPFFDTSIKLQVNPEFRGEYSEHLRTNYGFTGVAFPEESTQRDISDKPLTLNSLITHLRSMDKEKPTYILRAGSVWPIIGVYYIRESGSVVLQALVHEYAYDLT